jgi:arginine exporter protein ArgO
MVSGIFLMPHRVAMAASGGITALGAIIAQAPNTTESQAGVWVGVAGLLGMAASLVKEYYADQRNRREANIKAVILAEQLKQHVARSKRNTKALHKLNMWVGVACAKHQDLPAPPEIDIEDFDDSDSEVKAQK